GAARISQEDCNTRDAAGYLLFLDRVLAEARRIRKPGGVILIHTGRMPMKWKGRLPRIRFQLVGANIAAARNLRARSGPLFSTRFARVPGIRWVGLPVWVYHALIRKYSRRGDCVAHIFSGTGNCGLAALAEGRVPILVDLHHHLAVQRRLRRAARIGLGVRSKGAHQSRLRGPRGVRFFP
ncbi:MAG: hypothetical protein ACRD5L_13540, partial [Bryobacteraceae bacterium]